MVLIGGDSGFRHFFALGDLGQAALILDIFVATLIIDFHKTIKADHLTVGAQHHLAISTCKINRGALQTCASHLAGYGAFPDQVVKLSLVRFGQAQLFRIGRHFGGTYTFMRLLGIFGFILIKARTFRHIRGTKTAGNFCTRGDHGFGRHIDAVGPHIGDVTRLI